MDRRLVTALTQPTDVETVPLLLAALADSNPDTRQKAAYALGFLGDVRAILPLIDTLSAPQVYIRESAALALGHLHAVEAVSILEGILAQDPIETVRHASIAALGMIGGNEALAVLLERLPVDNNESTLLARALACIGLAAVPQLLSLLRTDDTCINRIAIDALSEIDSISVVSLAPLLADSDPEIRKRAIKAIKNDHSLTFFEAFKSALTDANEEVRITAARTLIGRKNSKYVPLLIRALDDPSPEVRQGAATTLGYFKDQKAIPTLLPLLNDHVSLVRRSAIFALGLLAATDLTPKIISALNDPDTQLVETAIDALGQLGDARAIDPLLALLKDQNVRTNIRYSLSTALGRFGKSSMGRLLDMLNEKDGEIRYFVVQALRQLDLPIQLDVFRKLLSDPNPKIRALAAEELGKSNDPQACDVLLAMADDANSWARAAILKALGKLGDNRAVPPLLEAVQSTDSYVAYNAAYALGEIGDVQAVPVLRKVAINKDGSIRMYDAVFALARLGEKWAIEHMLALAQDREKETDTREWAIFILGKCRGDNVYETLVCALLDSAWEIRNAAVSALGNLGDKRAVVPIMTVAAYESEGVRMWAAEALGQLGDPQALPLLEMLSQDADRDVQERAQAAVEHIRHIT